MTQAERVAVQMQPIVEAIRADPVKARDRLIIWSVGCWFIGLGMGMAIGVVWAIVR